MNFILPITQQQLLTDSDRALIDDLGTTVVWTIEYALHLWRGLVDWDRTFLYETVVDDFTDTFFLYNGTPADIRRQLVFPQRVHEFIDLLERIRTQYNAVSGGELDRIHHYHPIDALFFHKESKPWGITILQCRFKQDVDPDPYAYWSSK